MSDSEELDPQLSFNDLKRAGIVNSWETLREWQDDPRIKFPRGRLLGPNTRRWSKRQEIDPWLESRPTDRSAFEDSAATPKPSDHPRRRHSHREDT